jgi:hypothetical protein
MSPKQPSKQKRAAQNRNQRAAREARAANANVAPTSRATGGPSAGGASGSLLSRLRGGGTTRPPSMRAAAAQGRALQPPGFRAALSGLFAAVAAVLLCTLSLRYPVDARGDLYTSEQLAADWSLTAAQAAADQPGADAAEVAASIEEWAPGRGRDTVVQALWPFSLAIALPVLGAGLAFQAVRKRASSKVVNRTLYATLFGAVLTQGLLLLFLPVVLAVAVAMFQVRKAEAIAAAEAAPGEDGVIEVDEVTAEDDGVVDVDEVDDEPAEDRS